MPVWQYHQLWNYIFIKVSNANTYDELEVKYVE